MRIPRHWFLAQEVGRLADGREVPIKVWGWGDDSAAAEAKAGERLRRLLEGLARGERLGGSYAYASRPLREEILEELPADPDQAPMAMITRNAHGVEVLNTAGLLFLDIDVPPATFLRRLLDRLGLRQDTRYANALAELRTVLQENRRGTFRIYRTAAGYRVIAVDRIFDPAGADTKALMAATGTDLAYVRLCAAQSSFRARLTPKPWRCGVEPLRYRYPLSSNEARRGFEAWLKAYKDASEGFAVCRFVETVGTGRPAEGLSALIDLHDRMVDAKSAKPLA